jgi:hypothetical protein
MYLSELLRHTTNSVNYVEHWITAPGQEDITYMYIDARSANNINLLYKYYGEIQKRIEFFNKTNNWVAKAATFYAGAAYSKFVDRCVHSSNTTVWLTHRANIVDQFLSFINATYRLQYFKEDPGGFLYNEKTKHNISNYKYVEWPDQQVTKFLISFLQMLMSWRQIYDRYRGRINIVSYDENILTNDFTKFGISDDVVKSYYSSNKNIPLVPTPYNRPLSNQRVWSQCVDILRAHQHLVEINR